MSFMSELLSRCENSDDADKRELAVYVRKLEGIRDRLEKQLHQARTETTHVTRALNNCAKARGELAELKDRYRWRKQSEEPAPLKQRVFTALYANERWMFKDSRYSDYGIEDWDYWRPIDTPEGEVKP